MNFILLEFDDMILTYCQTFKNDMIETKKIHIVRALCSMCESNTRSRLYKRRALTTWPMERFLQTGQPELTGVHMLGNFAI